MAINNSFPPNYNSLTYTGMNQNTGSPFYPGQTIESAFTSMYAQLHNTVKYQTNSNGQMLINTYSNQVNIDELATLIPIIKKRLLVLDPLFSKHELYPALKKAYDDYLLIAKMIDGDDTQS